LSVTIVAIKPDGKILVAGTLTGEPPCPTCEKVGLFQFVGDR